MSGLSASCLFQEFQDRIVYVFGSLLLSPMTATLQDDCLAKQGHELFQFKDGFVHSLKSVNQVSIDDDIEYRDLNLVARPWREQLPSAFNVTVRMKASPEAGALVLPNVEFQVFVREPRRQ